ncbi:MAG TPA: hypothetical protein V6C97_11905 [Oculatellaceae cyanobacterium]
MNNIAGLWHPISEANLYKSAGSRSSFNAKWSRKTWHFSEPTATEQEDEPPALESLQSYLGGMHPDSGHRTSG